MAFIKRHSELLKGVTLGIVAFVMIVSPFSVSLEDTSLLRANIANAYACGSAEAVITPSSNPAEFRNAPQGTAYACMSGDTDAGGTTSVVTRYYDANDVFLSTQVITPTVDGSVVANIDKDGNLTKVAQPTSCAGFLSFMTNPFTCMFRTLVSLTAATLIYISSWILAMAGLLFNWLVQHTIIEFSTQYGLIKDAVEKAWTAFRDIANILIIGIFTFIAISIILGLKEYGQKRFIANVLIIAVLINFSLLFTKMIIDGSNYSATQIFTAAALGADTGGSISAASTTNAAYQTQGIAGKFIDLLGVGTFSNAYKLVSETADAKDSGWVALLHGILVAIVLLGAALVLLYGCFLLVSRMIMLIFLMVTASVAFASYLIPKWSGSSYGWSAWWSSLLWCAVFAPILMFLLWMTLSVSYGLKKGSTETLGAALSDPTGGANINALFMYVMVLGLLFATFKVSSMTANKIGGFSFAQMAAALPFTMGSRALGFGLRQTLGMAGYFGDKGLTAEAKKFRDRAGELRMKQQGALNRGDSAGAKRFGAVAGRFETWSATKEQQASIARKAAESKLNVMNTGAAKAVMKQIGVSGFAAGESSKDAKSYADQIKVRAEAAEKAAAKIAPSKEQNEATKEKIREERRDRRELLEATKKSAEQQRKPIEELMKAAQENQRDAVSKREKNQGPHDQQLQQARENARAADQNYDADHRMIEGDEAERRDIHARFTGQTRELQLQTQAARISAARQSVQQFEATHVPIQTILANKTAQYTADNRAVTAANNAISTLNRRLTDVTEPVTAATTALNKFNEETENLGKAMVAGIGESAEKVAEKIGRTQGPPLARLLGTVTGANAEVGEKAKAMYKKKIKTSDLAAVMKDLQDENK